MTLPPNDIRTLKRGIETANAAEADLEWLRQVAEVDDSYKERYVELRDLADHTKLLCSACLTAAGIDPGPI